jgi:hypothetical protein
MNKMECGFEYRVLRELPGGPSNIVYIRSEDSGAGRDGVMVQLFPDNGKPWIGIFAFGDILPSGDCQVFPGPGRSHLTVLAKGNAYVVSPNNPDRFICVKSCPVIRALPVPSRKLMLFHDYTEIVAYNENGLAWETDRISWDGITIENVTEDEVIGEAWDAPNEKYVGFSVDLTDGSHRGGSSPPDYLRS